MQYKNKTVFLLLRDIDEGGVENVFIRLAMGLKKKNINVEFVVFNDNGILINKAKSISKINSLNSNKDLRNASLLDIINLVNKFRILCKIKRPVAVISAKEQPNILSLFVKLLFKFNYKTIITRHAIMNNSVVGNDASPFLPLIYKFFLCFSDHIVAVSEGINLDIKKNIFKRFYKKVKTICNPVINSDLATKSNEVVKQLSINEGLPTLVSISRLSPQKGIDSLIKACNNIKQHQDFNLIIFGDGPLKEQLNQLIMKLELTENVFLLGWFDNPYPYLKKYNFFVLTSRWEALPTVLIEALYLQCKILSTDCEVGPSEILGDGKYGLLVEVDNIDNISKGILHLINNSNEIETPDLTKYTEEFSVDQYLKLL